MPRFRNLKVESLESRELLAGNVLMTFDSTTNTFDLTGDALANEIIVDDDPNFTTFRGVSGTTINGFTGSFGLRWTSSPTINVNLGAGDNRIIAREMEASSFSFAGGSGNNRISVINSDINVLNIEAGTVSFLDGNNQVRIIGSEIGRLDIGVGNGSDMVRVVNSEIARSVSIRSSALPGFADGNDDVRVVRSNIGGNTLVQTNSGDDRIIVTKSRISRGFIARGEAGDDVVSVLKSEVENLRVNGAAGDDIARLSYSEVETTFVNLGNGDDSFLSFNSHHGNRVDVFGGNGNDAILKLGGLCEDVVFVDSGNGDDAVASAGTEYAANTEVRLGDGNDRVFSDLNLYRGVNAVFGDAGFDIFIQGRPFSSIELGGSNLDVELFAIEVGNYRASARAILRA